MFPEKYIVKSYEATRLDDQELQKLVSLIKPLYLCFYPTSTEERMRERLTRHAATEIDCLFNGEIFCAFGVYYLCEVADKKILFRDGTMVDQNEQSRGLYRLLVQYALDKHSPDFMVTRTQNPRVYEMFKKFSSSGAIYPSEGIVPPQEVVTIARLMCHEGAFDPETLAAKNVYNRGQGRNDAPFFAVRDQNVARFFGNISTADAFMVVVPTN